MNIRTLNIAARYLVDGDQYLDGRTVHTVTQVVLHDTLAEVTTTRYIAGQGHIARTDFVDKDREFAILANP